MDPLLTELAAERDRLRREVAERERAEALLAGQKAVLELIACGAPIAETLPPLARFIEAQGNGMLCSILLLDPDGLHLRHGAGPSLPEDYLRAIDGLPIGPSAGSCGTAAFRRQPVVVADVAADPLWDDYRHLALPHGLRACWSWPIIGHDGAILGTLAVYHRRPCRPRKRDHELVGIALDLTRIALERRRVDEERTRLLAREQAARVEAEEAVRARDEFLSIAAHELKNPVAGIRGAAQLLQRFLARGVIGPEHLARYVPAIDQTSRHLSTLIDDLLDVSRLRSGHFPLRLEPIDLGQLLGEVIRDQTVGPDHRLRLEGADGSCRALADPDRLRQVLANLLDNAVKYSPNGGEILIALSRDAAGLLIRVEDHGIGLPEGADEQIFQPFGRAPNAAARNLPGLGLGLYICRRIADAHGGRLWAESPGDGRGTAFLLRLPDAGAAGTGAGGD